MYWVKIKADLSGFTKILKLVAACLEENLDTLSRQIDIYVLRHGTFSIFNKISVMNGVNFSTLVLTGIAVVLQFS